MKPYGPYVAARTLHEGAVRTLRGMDRVSGMPVLLYLLPTAPGELPHWLHRRLIPFTDEGSQDGARFVVSELPPHAAPASDPQVAARGLLEALVEIHASGRLHGGLTPAQVWAVDGDIRLAGAGLPWGELGAGFDAPEGGKSQAADLYALGCTLEALGGVPDPLRALLSEDPAARPSAQEALAALRHPFAPQPEAAQPDVTQPAPADEVQAPEFSPDPPISLVGESVADLLGRLDPPITPAPGAPPAVIVIGPVPRVEPPKTEPTSTEATGPDAAVPDEAVPQWSQPAPAAPPAPTPELAGAGRPGPAPAIDHDGPVGSAPIAPAPAGRGAPLPAPIQIGFDDDLPPLPLDFTPGQPAEDELLPAEPPPAAPRRPAPTPWHVPAAKTADGDSERPNPRQSPIRIGWEEDQSWRVVREAKAPPTEPTRLPSWWWGPLLFVVLAFGAWAVYRSQGPAPAAGVACCQVRFEVLGASGARVAISVLSAPPASGLKPGVQVGTVPGRLKFPDAAGAYRLRATHGQDSTDFNVTVPAAGPVQINLVK